MPELFPAPFLRRLEALPLRLAKVAGRAGDRSAMASWGGQSDEFMGHTAYSQGDDLRHLDWAAYGRSDRLLLRTFRPGQEQHTTITCDCSASMRVGEQGKLIFGLRLAAAIGQAALSGGQALSLRFEGRDEALSPGTRLSSLLGVLSSSFERRGSQVLGRRVAEGHATSGRHVMILDGLDDPTTLRTRASGQSAQRILTLLAVYARDEIAPRLSGRYRLEDSETGDNVDLDIGPNELATYGRELAEHMEAWRVGAASCKAHLMTLVSDQDPIDVLLSGRQALGTLAHSTRRHV